MMYSTSIPGNAKTLHGDAIKHHYNECASV